MTKLGSQYCPRVRRVVAHALAGVVVMSTLSACDVRQDRQRDPDGASSATTTETRAAHGSVTQARSAAGGSGFDFFLLSLSLHGTFCADHRGYQECRAGASHPLVLHGLWPENRAPRTYPHDCPAPPLRLEPALARELEDFMPGMRAGLEKHEWREHGGCSGLDANDYFRSALDLTRTVDAALSPTLTTLAGRQASAAQLRDAADEYRPGLGATLTFHCRVPRGPEGGGQRWLFEIRQCVDNDGPGGAPGTLLHCADVDRRDQGCGASFRIAAP